MLRCAAVITPSLFLVACFGQSSSGGEPGDGTHDSRDAGSQGNGESSTTAGDAMHDDDTSWGGAPDQGVGASFSCTAVHSATSTVVLRDQADVTALRGVSSLNQSLLITGDVNDLSELACLSHISGDLYVGETSVLENLSGLENLRSVDGAVRIGEGCQYSEPENCHGNLALESVAALRNLEHAEMIVIAGECFGESQTGCTQNAALEKVEFDRVTELEGVGIVGNPAMTEASFAALTHLGGLRIDENQELESVAFGSLVDVDGAFSLEDLPHLTHAAFGGLAAVGDRFDVVATGLHDLSGFGNLAEMTFLSIEDNPSLLALVGLHPKELVRLTIWDNPLLEDLRALASLRSVSTHVNIRGNPNLPTCEVSWLVDSIGEDNIHGSVLIADTDDSASCSP